MKNVVALLGSKRKLNTYSVLLKIKELLKKYDINVEILKLYDYDIKPCIGCEICVLKGDCVLKDNVSYIMEKIANADGIILASPVYLQQVSGKIKTFVDRTCSWYHRPVLASKPIFSVVTTKGSGLKATLKYLENVSSQWGAITAGCLGRKITNIHNPVRKAEVSNFINLINNPKLYSPTLNQLIGFEVQKALALHFKGIDIKHWKEKGWINKPYFYECKINPFKKMISGLIGSIIRSKMSDAMPVGKVLERQEIDKEKLSDK